MQSNSQKIKLSIITVNKNNAAGLERTIQSVINQTFKDFEYIIIDGASTDGSVDVIKKYENKINYWISEPDTGIYNAMNKGIKAAKGEYLLFLNSGDHLVNDTILEEAFKLEFDEDIIYGNLVIDGNRIVKYPDKLSLMHFVKWTLPHPSSFIKRKLFYEYGFYNERHKIASDFEFFIKTIIIHQSTYKHIDKTISIFYSDGISSKNTRLQQTETKEILQALFPRIYPDYIYFLSIEEKYQKLVRSRLVNKISKFQQTKLYTFLKSTLKNDRYLRNNDRI